MTAASWPIANVFTQSSNRRQVVCSMTCSLIPLAIQAGNEFIANINVIVMSISLSRTLETACKKNFGKNKSIYQHF